VRQLHGKVGVNDDDNNNNNNNNKTNNNNNNNGHCTQTSERADVKVH
jgi:hypothetical protein